VTSSPPASAAAPPSLLIELLLPPSLPLLPLPPPPLLSLLLLRPPLLELPRLLTLLPALSPLLALLPLPARPLLVLPLPLHGAESIVRTNCAILKCTHAVQSVQQSATVCNPFSEVHHVISGRDHCSLQTADLEPPLTCPAAG